MATKDAIVFIIDVGPSMWRNTSHVADGQQTRWEIARQLLIKLVMAKIVEARKTDLVGIILLGCNENNHDYDSYSQYRYIRVLKQLSMANLVMLHSLDEDRLDKGEHSGDCLEALMLAGEILVDRCGQQRYNKRVYLITDAVSPMNSEHMELIEDGMKQEHIRLDIIGFGFEATQAELEEKLQMNVTQHKLNELHLRELVNNVHGCTFTSEEAWHLLSQFRPKSIRSAVVYRGTLSIGDERTHPDTALEIPIQIYVKTSIIRRPIAERCLSRETNDGTIEHSQAILDRAYFYYDDESNNKHDAATTHKVPVPLDKLRECYTFGAESIPVEDVSTQQDATTARKCLQVIGFIPASTRYFQYAVSNVYQVMPLAHPEAATTAVSAFAYAMQEKNAYALVRHKRYDNADPQIGLLWPCIKENTSSFYYIQLPFAEDIQRVMLPSLDTTNAGSSTPLSRHTPTPQQMACMDEFVEQLSLVSTVKHADGTIEQHEDYPSGGLVPIGYQHVQHCIQQRALHPQSPLPSMNTALFAQLEQPKFIQEQLPELIDTFDHVFPTCKIEVDTPETNTEMSTSSFTNNSSIISKLAECISINEESRPIFYISLMDIPQYRLIPEFEIVIRMYGIDYITRKHADVTVIIERLIEESHNDDYHPYTVLYLRAFRLACIKNNRAEIFNEWYPIVYANTMRYHRSEAATFWRDVKQQRISLITTRETSSSWIPRTYALKFLDTLK
ncbi:SPOC like C-terminal domain-containing protein [Syncephalis plumigaleata]|nr:SPOC like C-terminal domain-containing protein [Syncephalis plumigaleata]